MTDARGEAERLLRRFARDTNLLVAGRPFTVTGGGPVAEALATMLRGMGALVLAEGARAADASAEVGIDVTTGEITLGGRALTSRGDAAGRLAFAAAHMPVST
ncbi:MAG: hypothetical protein ACK5IM_03850, partial [Demequina sp.]|uniref:hypothetical protein n=1 Tax=Demequina sp. TaxID=2050685 RepID=UPI003A85A275